ncbi:MAG: M23 family metallopeptidase [Vicingaceae bacterium]|nr:M23 family metallopeptidase [Vicingaceae bacterium]
MRTFKLTYLSLLLCLLQSLNVVAYSLPSDSITGNTEVIEKEKTPQPPAKPGIVNVCCINAFVDSINATIPDTATHYDWITNDIHIKKFDFAKIQDTLTIILNDSNDHYTQPFKGEVTSEFGRRRWRYHYGTDIDLVKGDTVRSAFNGKVRISTYSKSYGHVVVVRHDNGLETIYAHLSKRLVEIDSIIPTGTQIGLGGNTGHSFGSHLHFEVRYFDEPLDPRDVISFEDFTTLSDTLTISQCNFAYKDELKIMGSVKYHRVRSGNTLGHIARKYGTSINTLCRLNGIKRTSILQIGQRIRVR